MLTVYCASKAKHAPWWHALRAANVPITSTWIDWEGNSGGVEPTPDMWCDHWDRIIKQAASCDICLFVCFEGETACGQLIEAGSALAAGKRVFIVSDYQWTFANHPRCRVFATLEDAIAAIMAGAQGTRVTSIPRTERRRRLRPVKPSNTRGATQRRSIGARNGKAKI